MRTKGKIAAALLIALSMVVGLLPMASVSAYSNVGNPNLVLQYSYDKTNWTTITGDQVPTYKDKRFQATITAPDYVDYAYVKITAVPDGWTLAKAELWNEYTQSLTGESGYTGGTFKKQYDTDSPAAQDGSGNYIIPLKNENGDAKFEFACDGVDSKLLKYFLRFKTKHPRLTSFTDNTTNANGGVWFVSGGAANNNNGTFNDTSATGNTIHALGNISKKLVGASMFMLPELSSTDSATDNTVFSFAADHSGYVVVMSDTAFDAASVYAQGTEGWTCVNNGAGANAVSMGVDGALLQSRAYNDYTDTDYLAVSTKWYVEPGADGAPAGYSLYRTYNPGIDGNTTVGNDPATASTVSSAIMNKAYKKYFGAGDTVAIKGWGHSSQNTAIFVVWGDFDLEEDTNYGGGTLTLAANEVLDVTNNLYFKNGTVDATNGSIKAGNKTITGEEIGFDSNGKIRLAAGQTAKITAPDEESGNTVQAFLFGVNAPGSSTSVTFKLIGSGAYADNEFTKTFDFGGEIAGLANFGYSLGDIPDTYELTVKD